MNIVGVTDFQMSDVTKPQPKVTARNLSALLNFVFFRTERSAAFDEYDNEFVRDELLP